MIEQRVPNLGAIPAADARRDAVHVAVAPVVAREPLRPGWHVCLDDTGLAFHRREGAVGVVDPFLEREVGPGEPFWLFLYPGTVTSLRHVWTHPAFTAKVPQRVRELSHEQ